MRRQIYWLAVLVLCGVRSMAETSTNVPPTVLKTETNKWSFSASAYAYLVPEERDYVQPTIAADYGWLHLEARYNYEALDTGSAWVGFNFGGGDAIEWEFSPMVGGVFGESTGIAPGYKGSVSWWKIELYSEGEFFVDAEDPTESFFYNWSELTLAPVEWFRFGMVTQRTRSYESEREIQRGLLLGFSFGKADVSFYALNPDDSDPIFVIAFGLSL